MLAILVRNLSSESLRNKTSYCNYLKPTLAIHPFFLVSESMKTCPEKKNPRQASSLSSILFSLAMADSQRHWVIGQTRKIFFLPVGISPSRLTLQDILINLHQTRTSYNNEKWFSEALHSVNRNSLIERKAISPLKCSPCRNLFRPCCKLVFFICLIFSFFFLRLQGSGIIVRSEYYNLIRGKLEALC